MGNSLQNYVKEYNNIYAFEANPNFCILLKRRFAIHSNVNIINAAVCEKHNDVIDFNISKNNGDSSSILEPNPENELFSAIKSENTIKVPTVNLSDFLIENNINYVDSYISDLQGYDFIVLKTLKPYIDDKKIKEIQCEVEFNDKIAIYISKNKNDENKEKNFDAFLEKNYEKVAKGWGHLNDGNFEEVPKDWCEHDIKWIVKK